MIFEYWRTSKGWHFHLKAANGEILCHSETYTRKRTCLNAIKLVKSSASAKVQELKYS